MEESLRETKLLISRYLRQDERIARQKLAFLGQSEPRSLLIEGLKLLSLCIEIDSCDTNCCTHNTEGQSVENFLFQNHILCPSLPLVVPDGMKLNGNILIILECFVRSNPTNFQQKYQEDSVKLDSLKGDLERAGISLIPIIDGRTSYYNSLMEEWVCDQFRHNLFKLLEFEQENNALFEESEYLRLCESLNVSGGRASGAQGLHSLLDCRGEHYNEILKACHIGIDPSIGGVELKGQIENLYQVFRQKLKKGVIKHQFRKVDQKSLLKEYCEMYKGIGICGVEETTVDALAAELPNISPILRYIHLRIDSESNAEVNEISNLPTGLRSAFNKVKSLKVLNTRRKLLLLIDTIILMSHCYVRELFPTLCERDWLGSSFFSVGDRLVSVGAIQHDLSKWLKRRLKANGGVGQKSTELHKMINTMIQKSSKALGDVGLSFESYGVSFDFLNKVGLEEIMRFKIVGVTPTISYIKTNQQPPIPLREFSAEDDSDLKMLSSLSLSLVNSMKTSSTVKTRQNAMGRERYRVVQCKECYYQELGNEYRDLVLLYQKTGEGSKCYSVNSKRVGEICSFYADPKRYFCPIFSENVITKVIDTMMTWLMGIVELEDSLRDIKKLTKMILLVILCQPSKRSQKLLQNLRYFIMAFVSDYHHVELFDKLREELITDAEFFLFKLLGKILTILLNDEVSTMLNNRFKFILNISYFCHFITKETPDRLTDQIKCFEKYLEPKIQFGSLTVNPKETPTDEEKDDILHGVNMFLSKKTCDEVDDPPSKKPGVSKKVFSLMLSAFNSGLLFKESELKKGMKDPLEDSGSATALDLASNKSVVINKYTKDGRVLDYNYDKLVSVAVCQLSEIFSRKGKYLLNKEDYDYKIQEVLSSLVIGSSKSEQPEEILDVDSDYMDQLKASVERVLDQYKPNRGVRSQNNDKSVNDLKIIVEDELSRRLILGELSYHLVEDFDKGLLSENFYKEVCEKAFNNKDFRTKYFYDSEAGLCPIEKMTQALATRTYMSGEYFHCFKSLLLQMDANKLSGKYSHYKSQNLNFRFDHGRLMDDSRISERESNSEALSKALSLVNCLTSALKNLCFYSQESPSSYTETGPDTGRMKFSLSYKEQVGGNRELYIGDLRTKMFTRFVEDYFESYTKQLEGSCLNNEKEFEKAILGMKLGVSLAHASYSLDHSKWGPMMCPFLFLMLYRNLSPKLKGTEVELKGCDNISTILSWHIHKLVEVPFNVVTAMMRSYIKRKLGIMKDTSQTITESLFFSEFERGVIPSHFSSVLDMGQGILHNTSDFYGLISERFINYALRLVSGNPIEAYTSSDDQISLFSHKFTELMDTDPEEFLIYLEFHNYLSSLLNKFISPKSVVGRFVAEFKSRFYVWGDEVPLLSKFVAASLHNIKCKEPHQLAETVDTIIDQAVANGVPVSVCNEVQKRTLRLLEFSKYPIDPFLLHSDSDVKDWVDGNRGYRIMRVIEQTLPEGTASVRSLLRILYNKLKSNELHEEFASAYLSQNRSETLVGLAELMGVKPPSTEDLMICWLNLTACHPLRMVLRQKVIYPSALNLEEEKVPTLIRTLQNKLSSGFTRGAQKLLSEAVNKSAFQSSIASGFVGLCKTLGSKCVRDPERESHYIKSIIQYLQTHCNVKPLNKGHLNLWVYESKTDDTQSASVKPWQIELLRPLLWDYLCIALSTSLEIGPWVLGEPVFKVKSDFWKPRPCDYFPLRPAHNRILEDRIGMNHIIHAVRRLYPEMFEKHLLPYMSDLAAMKLKWSPRIKFLDLCVTLDVNCEALSLISHVVKWKREEHYIVLSDDLLVSHDRKHTTLMDETVVSTSDVADNFLKQIYFESFVKPFVATSRTLGSFSWFPHRSSLPQGEGIERLGPFSTFIEKVVFKGIERPMYRYDLFMGYSWLDYEIELAHLNQSQLIASGLTEESCFEDVDQFWHYLSTLKVGSVKLSKTVRLTQKTQGKLQGQKFSVHLNFTGFITNSCTFVPKQLEVLYSGPVDEHFVIDCWSLLKSDREFKAGASEWFVHSDVVDAYISTASPSSEAYPLDVWLEPDLLELSVSDISKVGPEVNIVPLVVEDGHLLELKEKVAIINPVILDQDIEVFINELKEDHWDLLVCKFADILKHRQCCNLYLINVDILTIALRILNDKAEEFISKSMQEIDQWFDFKGYSLCFSKSRRQVMRHSSTGTMRLKGRLCQPAFYVEVVEEID
ncbi:L protein [Mammarenavirus ippyense]|uniref:RNA-directed RNA polymerase L n=1 Tax=Ippy mammarenavirus (isolate Rat/Central African Republic/Dak An B 188 d/1970) TaxID=3052308 RepID=L_IPPYV|nr:L protein [Mammarenavirus ippyense]Q27YE1.1 RecName: Full=RNA-directed RNA polymerase L; Short=Protein L; AltName: Full=Large structural protein; AltName: Full=Replicase; AltName: Full=Transcriptase; Includes: RecName: Full=cap-snatching endonuclease [Mammarenavirus ippyense]ABC71143.1 L protein [Mammarenavirus ippyense]